MASKGVDERGVSIHASELGKMKSQPPDGMFAVTPEVIRAWRAVSPTHSTLTSGPASAFLISFLAANPKIAKREKRDGHGKNGGTRYLPEDLHESFMSLMKQFMRTHSLTNSGSVVPRTRTLPLPGGAPGHTMSDCPT